MRDSALDVELDCLNHESVLYAQNVVKEIFLRIITAQTVATLSWEKKLAEERNFLETSVHSSKEISHFQEYTEIYAKVQNLLQSVDL